LAASGERAGRDFNHEGHEELEEKEQFPLAKAAKRAKKPQGISSHKALKGVLCVLGGLARVMPLAVFGTPGGRGSTTKHTKGTKVSEH
jgi:hypothetical protein